jgi:hypothetical protein
MVNCVYYHTRARGVQRTDAGFLSLAVNVEGIFRSKAEERQVEDLRSRIEKGVSRTIQNNRADWELLTCGQQEKSWISKR